MVNLTREVYCILGLPFDAIPMATVINKIRAAVADQTPCFISTPNTNFVIVSLIDSVFRNSVIHSDLCVADGMPIIWIARLLDLPIKERVSGASFFEVLREERTKVPLKVYFFGGIDGVAKKAHARLNAEGRNMVSVGFESPGFADISSMSDPSSIAKINESQVDFLVVALGAKKGQAWIDQNRHKLNIPVVCHLGAVINFVAGTIKRAPMTFQSLGFEWLWRIYQEPKLWQRYFHDAQHLFNLLVNKVIPYAVWIRLNRKLLREQSNIQVDLQVQESKLLVRLDGSCLAQNLAELRFTLAEKLNDGYDIELDLANVKIIDSAFIGFLMLLYGYTEKSGQKLSVININDINKKIFDWNCASFLLGV